MSYSSVDGSVQQPLGVSQPEGGRGHFAEVTLSTVEVPCGNTS